MKLFDIAIDCIVKKFANDFILFCLSNNFDFS